MSLKNSALIIFCLVIRFDISAQELIKDKYGTIKVCVVYPSYAEDHVNENSIKIVRKDNNTDLIHFPDEVLFSFDNQSVWYKSQYVNVSAMDQAQDHVITVYWGYVSLNDGKCDWGNFLRSSCYYFKDDQYVGDVFSQRKSYSGTPESKKAWWDLISKWLTEDHCALDNDPDKAYPFDFIRTKTLTLNRTNQGISERISIETNLAVTAFFSNANSNRFITSNTTYGYKDIVRMGQQNQEMSRLTQESLENTAKNNKTNSKTVSQVQTEQAEKQRQQQDEIDHQRSRAAQIDKNTEQRQKEAAAVAGGVVAIATLGILTNNEKNVYHKNSSQFGFGLGFLSETFPYIVNYEETNSTNGRIQDRRKTDTIQQEGTVGVIADMKYSPFISKAYQPKFKISGGYSIALSEIFKTPNINAIDNQGNSSDGYNETINHVSFFRGELYNYIGKGKTKFIIAGEYESKNIFYTSVNSLLSTYASESIKVYDTSYTSGSLQNYRYGIGLSVGSPNKLNFEILVERCEYINSQMSSNFGLFANYNLRLNLWKASWFSLGACISTLNQFKSGTKVSDKNDDYQNKFIYQIHLIYNKDWFWKKK